MYIEEIICRFQGVKKIGDKSYQCRCSNHDDSKASLTITEDNNKILMHCHAGCDTRNILEAIGLTERDLFNDIKTEKTKIVKEYLYTDEKHAPLYKVVRFEPKNFMQSKCENGKWVWNMQNVRYVLYNLPSVIKSDTVYFVEGEKDADNLNSIGLVATTTVGGASSFNKRASEYANFLKDKNVYIIPDNDSAGYKYANMIKQALKGIASCVKILKLSDIVKDLKEKNDISDVLLKYGREETINIIKELIENSTDIEEEIVFEKNKKLNIKLFEEILNSLNIKIMFNEFSGNIDITNYNNKLSKSNINNTFPIYITDYINNLQIKCTTQKVADFITVIADKNRYNPVKNILDSAEWDKKDRIEELYNIMGIKNEQYKVYVKKWLLQCIAMLNNNSERNYSADGLLVLQGRQGIGKTSFFRKISIKEEFFTEGVSLNTENKDDLITCTSSWICELGELDDTLKRNQSIFKGVITRSVDKIRFPYGRSFISKTRKTSFCGTVNEEVFIKDTTGSRRLWIIKLDENYDCEKIKKLQSDWIIQLWKQIEEIWQSSDKKTCYRLTQEEMKLLEQANSEFDLYLLSEQEIEDKLDFSMSREKYKKMTATEIKEHLQLKHYDSSIIGKAVRHLIKKYPDYITNGRRGNHKIYILPLK